MQECCARLGGQQVRPLAHIDCLQGDFTLAGYTPMTAGCAKANAPAQPLHPIMPAQLPPPPLPSRPPPRPGLSQSTLPSCRASGKLQKVTHGTAASGQHTSNHSSSPARGGVPASGPTAALVAAAADVHAWAQFGDAALAALECRVPPARPAAAYRLGSAANPYLLDATVSLMLAHTATLSIDPA